MLRGDGPFEQGGRVEAETLDDIELHLVIIVEVLQELLVDRVQVDDEEVTHGLHHGPSRRAERYRSVPYLPLTPAVLTIPRGVQGPNDPWRQ